LLEEILRQSGHTNVSSTTNPRDVCALHRRQHFDLVLLDLQVPGMDGVRLIEALRADPADPGLPVLVITAQPAHKLRALQAGARDFISKPLDGLEAKTRIRNMLEVRLLYRKLREYDHGLEAAVHERTAQLRESEARYRGLTELASDWYWEQDENGAFTKVSGPVLEMIGIRVDGLAAGGETAVAGWNEAERARLQAAIAAREPFIDFVFSRRRADGTEQRFQVSGEPLFGRACQFVGYRGIGMALRGTP
jgi:PAS domain S-box-containing protein